MRALWLVAVPVILIGGCGAPSKSKVSGAANSSLSVAGFAVARDVYEKGLLPAFKTKYEASHPGSSLTIQQSYDGSGAQTRAILNGLPANVAALALTAETDQLAKGGLAKEHAEQFPATSIVVFAVRPGNPKNIRDWKDLQRSDVAIVTPNPATSGAAKWNLTAAYGAAIKSGQSPADAVKGLLTLKSRVTVFGKSGREAMQQFANGTGDVLITWENEALLRKAGGTPVEVVYPSVSLKMEPPVVVLDGSKGHANPVAEEFLTFLKTPGAKAIYAKHFFRTSSKSDLPTPPPLITIADLGGWAKVDDLLFGPNGAWEHGKS